MTALRSFIAMFAIVLGLTFAVFVVVLTISVLETEETDPTIEYNYSLDVVPNAQGVRKVLASKTPVILQIDISGLIGSELLSRATIEEQLIESREQILKDNRVKALLLKIDTPGGTVVDADGIYRAIKAYKAKYHVPVYAYVDGLCASGGMYVACSADKIFATETSLIGSVGVLIPTFVNVSTLLDKIGVQSMTISAGIGKDDLNPLRPWKSGEQDNMQLLTDYFYNTFVSLVSENRPNLKKDLLIKTYGAKIFPASMAKEFGYIDEINNSLGDVVALLAKEIHVEDDSYQVVAFKSKSWYASLFSSRSPLLMQGKVKHEIALPGILPEALSGQWLYLYRP